MLKPHPAMMAIAFLDCGVYVDPLQVFLGQVLFALCGFNGYLEQLLHSLGADPLSPFDKGGRIKRKLVLKELEPAEVLPVRILQKPLNRGLVA